MTSPDQDWSLARLYQLTEDVSNINPAQFPDQLFTYVDISAIDNERFVIQNPHEVLGQDAPSRARRPLREGDVLFSNVRTYLRNVAQVRNLRMPALASTGFTLLRAAEGVNGRYLFHLVRSRYFISLVNPEQTGSYYPATSDTKVRSLEVPVPSTHQQNTATELLDQVENSQQEVLQLQDRIGAFVSDTLRVTTARACSGELTTDWRLARAKANTETPGAVPRAEGNSGTLFSGLTPPSGDEVEIAPHLQWARLEDLALSIDYGTSHRASAAPSAIKVLRMGNIQDGELVWDDLRYLPKEAVPEKLLLTPGDLLFDRTNGSPDLVGKTAVFRGGHVATFASYLIRVRLRSDLVHPDWVSTWINSSWGRAWALRVRSVGVSQSNISGSKLAALRLPVPDYPEQLEILERLTRLRAASRRLEEAMAENRQHVQEAADTILDRTVAGPYYDVMSEGARKMGTSPQEAESAHRALEKPWVDVPAIKRRPTGVDASGQTDSLRSVVAAAGGQLEPGALWQASAFADDIDLFYTQLRKEISQGSLREARQENSLSLIELSP